MTVVYSAAIKADRLATLIADIGPGALLRIYGGARPADPSVAVTSQPLLTEHVCGSPFGTVAGIVLTANAILGATVFGSITNVAPTWYRIFKADGTTAVLDGSVGTASADLIIAFATVTTGDSIDITDWVVNAAAGGGGGSSTPPSVGAITPTPGDVDSGTGGVQEYVSTTVNYAATATAGTYPIVSAQPYYSLNGGARTAYGSPLAGGPGSKSWNFTYGATVGITYGWSLDVTDSVGTVVTSPVLTVNIIAVPVSSPGTVQLSASTYSVGEGAGTIVIGVTRTGGSSGAASVAYATANGTATAGSDYTNTSGTLNWADGDAATKNITVPITDDIAVESSETFTVTLSGVTGATLGSPYIATVTITDNDTANTRPGWLAAASGTTTATIVAGRALLTGSSNGGKAGNAVVTTTSGQYVFMVFLVSAGTPVFHDDTSGLNGGFSTIGSPYTDGSSNVWQAYRSDFPNAYPTSLYPSGASITTS